MSLSVVLDTAFPNFGSVMEKKTVKMVKMNSHRMAAVSTSPPRLSSLSHV